MSPQFGLFPEGGDELGSAAHVGQGFTSEGTQVDDVFGADVGQAVLFEVTPNVFDGIEFGRIGRKLGGVDASFEAVEVLADAAAAMDHSSIPDDQQFAGQLSLQVLKELDDLRTFDRAGMELEVEVPDRDAADDREFLPVEVKLQNRGLSARSPGAHPVGFLAEAAFVNEDNDSPFFQGFFLRFGQTERFQLAMAFSSRWMARVVGRWQLQPICPRSRQTWSGWYWTPKASLITLATRCAVQSSVAKPCAPGPALSECLSFSRSRQVRRAGRPAFGAFWRADWPPCSQAFCQRLADWQETPHRRATSAGANPFSNKPAALRRRLCSSSKSRFWPLGNPI